jgi:pyruvyltransferase
MIKAIRRRIKSTIIIVLSAITKKPKVFYFGKLNFGDLFNKDLFDYYLKDYYKVDIPRYSDICGLGSVLHMLPEDYGGVIMGTGSIKDDVHITGKLKYAVIVGLRGPLTQKLVKKNPNFIGDPGLLCTQVYQGEKLNKHSANVGIVLHYKDDLIENRIKISNLIKGPVTFISVEQPPLDVYKQISQCNVIYSSSLHGLIFSDDLRKPNIRLVLDHQIIGGDFKFDDYFQSVGRDMCKNTVDLRETETSVLNYPNERDNLAALEIIEEMQKQMEANFFKISKY